jgi:hypothetical protein
VPKWVVVAFWTLFGQRECINGHDIDQKRNNIGLLRVGMLFHRHALSVRWVVL